MAVQFPNALQSRETFFKASSRLLSLDDRNNDFHIFYILGQPEAEKKKKKNNRPNCEESHRNYFEQIVSVKGRFVLTSSKLSGQHLLKYPICGCSIRCSLCTTAHYSFNNGIDADDIFCVSCCKWYCDRVRAGNAAQLTCKSGTNDCNLENSYNKER